MKASPSNGSTAAMLEDLGHTVIQAADGPELLGRLEKDKAGDLIITDYAMPLVSGTEVIVPWACRMGPNVDTISWKRQSLAVR